MKLMNIFIPIIVLITYTSAYSSELENAGFESGSMGWLFASTSGTDCSFTISSDSYEGEYAAELNISNNGYCMLHNQNSIAVNVTSTYSIRVQAKANGDAIDHLFLGVYKASAPNTFPATLVDFVSIAGLSSSYRLYQFPVDLAEGEFVRLELGFQNGSDLSPGLVRFDAIEILDTQVEIDCSTQSYIPQIECEALFSLYNSMNGESWTLNTGWLWDENPDNWHGVRVSSGRVRGITLNNNLLSGSIPPEIGNLTALDRLQLTQNQLTGSIPPEIGSLSHLNDLSLAQNQLSGTIPPEIGNLTNLRWFLSLSQNQLSGPIPPELGNLTALESLLLWENQLSGPIPSELSNLSSLTSLSLQHNQLQGPVPLQIAQLGASLSGHCSFADNSDLCIPNIAEYQAIGVNPICNRFLENDCIVYGDLNGDGTMDLKDVITGLKAMTDNSAGCIYMFFSDPNGNDQIDMVDVLWTLSALSQ